MNNLKSEKLKQCYHNNVTDVLAISLKIRGLGELIRQQNSSALFDDETNQGIGLLLTDLADALAAINISLEKIYFQ